MWQRTCQSGMSIEQSKGPALMESGRIEKLMSWLKAVGRGISDETKQVAEDVMVFFTYTRKGMHGHSGRPSLHTGQGWAAKDRGKAKLQKEEQAKTHLVCCRLQRSWASEETVPRFSQHHGGVKLR